MNNKLNVDPLLGPLQHNGGSTETQALLDGSPAINMGSNALAVDTEGEPLKFDQRRPGFPRILCRIVDMGAYEYCDPTPPVLVGVPKNCEVHDGKIPRAVCVQGWDKCDLNAI